MESDYTLRVCMMDACCAVGSIDKAGGVGGIQHQGNCGHSSSHITTGVTYTCDHKITFSDLCLFSGLRLCETSLGNPPGPSIDPLEFWALLSSQGTFLIASVSVRDVLRWGTSEVIGRNIYAMVRDSQGGMREHVKAELAKLNTVEVHLSLLHFWSLTESTCSLTLGDVDGECGQPSAIDCGNISGAQRVAFGGHMTHVLPYPVIQQAHAILILSTTHCVLSFVRLRCYQPPSTSQIKTAIPALVPIPTTHRTRCRAK